MRDVRGRQRLAERFEEHRGQLRAVAYRMLGSLAEAEDAVQEAWLRLDRSGGEGVDNLGAWLATVTGRICLDLLRSPHRAPRGADDRGLRLLRAGPGTAGPAAAPTRRRRPCTPTRWASPCWGARGPRTGRAAGVRPARHVRRALRRHRAGRRAHPGRHPAARQPGPSPGAGRTPAPNPTSAGSAGWLERSWPRAARLRGAGVPCLRPGRGACGPTPARRPRPGGRRPGVRGARTVATGVPLPPTRRRRRGRRPGQRRGRRPSPCPRGARCGHLRARRRGRAHHAAVHRAGRSERLVPEAGVARWCSNVSLVMSPGTSTARPAASARSQWPVSRAATSSIIT
ncbi:hypothetical protein STENM223S_06530 [Streptomyces tendae]